MGTGLSIAQQIISNTENEPAALPLLERLSITATHALRMSHDDAALVGRCVSLLCLLSESGPYYAVLIPVIGLPEALSKTIRWSTRRLERGDDVARCIRLIAAIASVVAHQANSYSYSCLSGCCSVLAKTVTPMVFAEALEVGLTELSRREGDLDQNTANALWRDLCDLSEAACFALTELFCGYPGAEVGMDFPGNAAGAVKLAAFAMCANVRRVNAHLATSSRARAADWAEELQERLELPRGLLLFAAHGCCTGMDFKSRDSYGKGGYIREAAATEAVSQALSVLTSLLALLRSKCLSEKEKVLSFHGGLDGDCFIDPEFGSPTAWGRPVVAELMAVLFKGSAVELGASMRLKSALFPPAQPGTVSLGNLNQQKVEKATGVYSALSQVPGAGLGLYVSGRAEAGEFVALYPGEWRCGPAAARWWDNLPSDDPAVAYTASHLEGGNIDGGAEATARAVRAALAKAAAIAGEQSCSVEKFLADSWSLGTLVNHAQPGTLPNAVFYEIPVDWLHNHTHQQVACDEAMNSSIGCDCCGDGECFIDRLPVRVVNDTDEGSLVYPQRFLTIVTLRAVVDEVKPTERKLHICRMYFFLVQI